MPSANIPMVADRLDIHKSCKSIENLLDILNEYCEAAGAVFVLQKKLAKALRETAGLKITGDVSANALHTSATIFEALSDIDSKFSKVMVKEYDGVSNEVKKWFKKLAKEEKTHDERVIITNAKIKQAGLAYEKKSKKKASDVQEEHARYINLISTLGPEISQESQNHALNVTQRHTVTTYNVAASLSRVADAEWQKSCESIRRFSPTVGPLGEWRALCEGGWSGSIPQGLPVLDAQPPSIPYAVRSIEEDTQHMSSPAREVLTPEFRESTEQLQRPPASYTTSPLAQHSWGDLPLRARAYDLPPSGSLTTPRQSPYTATSSEGNADFTSTALDPPRLPFADPNTGSIRSLSAFPAPPAHFPLPPPRQQPQQHLPSAHSSNSNFNLPPQSMDSLLSANDNRPGYGDVEESDQTEHQQRTQERPWIQDRDSDSTLPVTTSPNVLRQPTATQPQMTMPTNIKQKASENLPLNDASHGSSSSGDTRPSNTHLHSQDDYHDNGREFGMGYNAERPTNSRTGDNSKSIPLERTESGSSLVVAMRNRFSNAPGSTSASPPRDLPRLPLSVNNLASRYETVDTLLSPKPKHTLPSRQQSLPLDTPPHQSQDHLYQDHLSISPQTRSTLSNSDDEQRADELIFSERRRREQQLIEQRERELEMRTQELERDRLWLVNMRENDENDVCDQSILRPRERRTSLRHQLERRLSQMDLDNLPETDPLGSSSAASQPNARSQYTTHLIPPLSPVLNTPPATIHSPHSPRYGQNSSQPPSPLQKTRLETTQYEQHEKTRRFPRNNTSDGLMNKEDTKTSTLAPLKSQDKAKSSGSWIRRFSMPVGNAFINLDSKRRQQSNSSLGSTSRSGISSAGPVQSGGGGGRGLFFSMDARKNVSTTALRIPGEGGDLVQENGRLRSGVIGIGRRSYEGARSMTNLGITAGRQ